MLPEDWIRPTGEETLNLVDYLARFIAKQKKSAFVSPSSLDNFFLMDSILQKNSRIRIRFGMFVVPYV